MKNHLMNLVMPVLPKHDLSHWVGRLVHKKLPTPAARLSVAAFARFYNIDMNEAEFPIERYHSIGDLFTRKLKAGLRPLGPGIVHPTDSRIVECGIIREHQCIQAKGKNYTVVDLLRNRPWGEAFEGGTFITYYLCPTDYHRVHSPLDGKITRMTHVPGELWPVNEWSVNHIKNLFTVNERVAVGIESANGKAALVMVAATNVGNMTLSFDENLRTNLRASERPVKEKSYDPAKEIRKGDEVGIFHMGSTVIMLYEKGMVPESVTAGLNGQQVKMGESIISH